jgi:hypothetical protein
MISLPGQVQPAVKQCDAPTRVSSVFAQPGCVDRPARLDLHEFGPQVAASDVAIPGDHLQLPPDDAEHLARAVSGVMCAEDRQQARQMPGQRGIDGAARGRYDSSAGPQRRDGTGVHQPAGGERRTAVPRSDWR